MIASVSKAYAMSERTGRVDTLGSRDRWMFD